MDMVLDNNHNIGVEVNPSNVHVSLSEYRAKSNLKNRQ